MPQFTSLAIQNLELISLRNQPKACHPKERFNHWRWNGLSGTQLYPPKYDRGR